MHKSFINELLILSLWRKKIQFMEITHKKWLFGKTLAELEILVEELGAKKFVAKQIADWLYKKNIDSLDQMSNLSLSFRQKLALDYTVGSRPFVKVDTSSDGTKKYLFSVENDNFVESAYIPDKERSTLCVSSQSGCRMGCVFCMTGRQKMARGLSAGEILNQVKSIPEGSSLNNIVYMGMGEPLDNTDEVLKSIEILTSSWGYAWSPTRITLSTIGVLPNMIRFIEESKANLTISLHSPLADTRGELMPIERKYPIASIVEQLKKYDFSHQRRLTFGYTMFSGVNDRRSDAEAICRLLKGLDCRINLIPFHQIPDSELTPSSRNRMVEFRDYLSSRGFTTTIRASRGEDIFAACGLLATTQNKKS